MLAHELRKGCALPTVTNQDVVRRSKTLQPLPEPAFEVLHCRGGAGRSASDRLDHGEQILRAVRYLVHQEFYVVFRRFALGFVGDKTDQSVSLSVGCPGNNLTVASKPEGRAIRPYHPVFGRK